MSPDPMKISYHRTSGIFTFCFVLSEMGVRRPLSVRTPFSLEEGEASWKHRGILFG